jgi:hypothetical protein
VWLPKGQMADFDETASRLRGETSELVRVFRDRTKRIRETRELLPLLRTLDEAASTDTALDLFGEGEHRAIGIDGSMATDELLEMIVFYANASAFGCPFAVTRKGLAFSIEKVAREERLDVSCTVPLWMEDLPAVAPSKNMHTDYDLTAISVKFPFAIMAMAEITIANSVVDNDAAKVIFMDRPLSGTHGPLARDYRELLKREELALVGWPTPFGPLSKLDLNLAYHLHDGNLRIPLRRRYLHYHVIRNLLNGVRLSYSQLAHDLRLNDSDLKSVRKGLKRLGEGLLEEGDNDRDDSIRMSDAARTYWKRVSFVVEAMKDRIFTGSTHALRLQTGDWVSDLELNAINLLMLRELSRKSIAKAILVIGIAKDTLATEFGRTVIPYSGLTSSTSSEKSIWPMKSDKSLLNIFSTSDEVEVQTPWRTLSYDAAFSSLVMADDKDPKLIAARRRMAPEQQFVRSYFELRSLSSDPKSKSPVFLYDRFFWPRFDGKMVKDERVREENMVIDASLYFEDRTNPLDNLVLRILSRSDNPDVLEAFGHNELLFMADKAVKVDSRTARGMLRGVVWLELGPLAKSDRMFNCARRFRDIRSEQEHSRSGGSTR